MAKAAQGEHVEFAFIPVTAVKYTYTVIPALVMTRACPISNAGWIALPRR